MNRNWDLIRHILLMADGRNVGRVKFDLGNLGYAEDDVDFHLSILGTGKGDAGFIKTISKNSGGRVDYLGDLMMRSGMVEEIFLHLTWKGREFLGLISNDETWRAIQDVCHNQETPISVIAIQTLAKKMIKVSAES